LASALRIRPLLAALALAGGGSATAAVIDAEVAFPGRQVPALKAYVCDVDTSRIKTVTIAAAAARFTVEVPAGRYEIFLAPNEPGAPDIYGAYTEYSLCMARPADPQRATAAACDDHALVSLNLGGKPARVAIRIDDWYLSDRVAGQLDRLRGLEVGPESEPLGAPHFSEYRAQTAPLPPPQLDFADSALGAEERELVLRTVAAGPNFAAQATLALLPCGVGCERIALVDWRNGRVSAPQGLGEVRRTLPCRGDEAVRFRRDSLLLEITRPRPGGVVTQYYLWKPESGGIALETEYRRDTAQFCRALPP